MFKLLIMDDDLVVDSTVVDDPATVTISDDLVLVGYDSPVGIDWGRDADGKFFDTRPLPERPDIHIEDEMEIT